MEILNVVYVVWQNKIYYVTNLKRTENRNEFIIKSILQLGKKVYARHLSKSFETRPRLNDRLLESEYVFRVRFGGFPFSVRTLFRRYLVRNYSFKKSCW